MITEHNVIGFQDNSDIIKNALIDKGFEETMVLECLSDYIWNFNAGKVNNEKLKISNIQILEAIGSIEFRLYEFKSKLAKETI